MIVRKKSFMILGAGIVIMTSCLLSHKNNRYLGNSIKENMYPYQDVFLIMDTLIENEERIEKHLFYDANFHFFDNYDSLCVYYKIVSNNVAFGWFSGKKNDTIFNIFLALTREKIIHNVCKKITFFDSQGKFYYMGDVRIVNFPQNRDGIPDSICVYMDSISPVCADELKSKFELDYMPHLKEDSITIKFY